MAKFDEVGFIQNIADSLREKNIPFEEHAVLEGLETDFWISAPDGTEIIAEVKAWEPTPKNQNRAIRLARYYRDFAKVNQGFVIIPDLKKGHPSKGLASEDEFVDYLNEKFREKVVPRKQKKVRTPFKTERKVFAAMPFSPKYNDTFFVAIRAAVKSVKAKCIRTDIEESIGDVTTEIEKNIRESIAVIADLSESRQDVMYETGLSHGLNIPTVLICSTSLEYLPFNLRNMKIIEYVKGQTYELRIPLRRRLRAVLKKNPLNNKTCI